MTLQVLRIHPMHQNYRPYELRWAKMCLLAYTDSEGPDITKSYLYNFDPLKPHFYIVKLGFTGVYIIFFISVQKRRLWNSLEPPRRGGSNEYPQSMF